MRARNVHFAAITIFFTIALLCPLLGNAQAPVPHSFHVVLIVDITFDQILMKILRKFLLLTPASWWRRHEWAKIMFNEWLKVVWWNGIDRWR